MTVSNRSLIPAVVFCCVMLLVSCMATQVVPVREYQFSSPPPVHNTGISQAFESIVVIHQGWGMGTGFVIDYDEEWTYIMTAHHVVDDSPLAYVDGMPATVYAAAPGHDLAILRLPTADRYQHRFEFSHAVIGSEVWALGYSGWKGERVKLVHRGHVVSTDFRGLKEGWVVIHNAGGRGGMSGGPLVNKEGLVVGIASFFADIGLGRFQANPSEFAAVPGVSAAVFWALVRDGLHLIPEEEVPNVDQ